MMDDKINKFNLIKKITFLKKLDIKKTKNKPETTFVILKRQINFIKRMLKDKIRKKTYKKKSKHE